MTYEEKLKEEIVFNERIKCRRVAEDRKRRLIKIIGSDEFNRWNAKRNVNGSE